jgi:hypothetical protein
MYIDTSLMRYNAMRMSQQYYFYVVQLHFLCAGLGVQFIRPKSAAGFGGPPHP